MSKKSGKVHLSKSFDFKVDGLEAVIDSMEELSVTIQDNLVKKSAAKAMEPVVDVARSLCPHDTGHLAASIGLKKIRQRGRYKKGLIVFSVGPRMGMDFIRKGSLKFSKPFKYGVPVEYGHVLKDGTFVPPAGFMRQAFSSQKGLILDRFTQELKANIEKAVIRARKKSAKAGAA